MLSASVSVVDRRIRAFTLIEMLVVISIIGILTALLFPVFARARISSQRTSCASNLHQAALALSLYQQDYGSLPPFVLTKEGNHSWAAMLPYTKSTDVTHCPYYWRQSDKGGYATIKWQLHGRPRMLEASTVVTFCIQHLDTDGATGFSTDKGTYIVAFGDGSTRRIDARQTSRWQWKDGKWMTELEALNTPGTGEPWPPE